MTKHILVIDDEEAIRKSFVLALEDTGYIVDTAESGTKGVQMQTEKKYDVIFLENHQREGQKHSRIYCNGFSHRIF